MKIQKPLDSTGRLGIGEHGVIIDLRDPNKVCICHGPVPQPCGPKCRYPYTDQRGGPYYSALENPTDTV